MDESAICPWSGFAPGTVRFCEEQLCGWITQPANTWSNLFYILAGLYIVKISKREGYQDLQAIGWIAILVGIGSFFFHASSTFIGEFCDLAAMFLFANFMLFSNIERLWNWPRKRVIWGYFSVNLFSLLVLLWVRPIGITLFSVLVTIAVLIEIAIGVTTKNRTWSYRPLQLLALTFAISYLFWNLDFHGIWCDPHNHWLQGHALWHTINSACFVLAYHFYKQFSRRSIRP